MSILFKNNAASYLGASLSADALALNLATGTGSLFPSPTGGDYFLLTLFNESGANEIVKVTARSVDTLTIVRAQEGTVAVAWPSVTTRAECRWTAGAAEALQAEIGGVRSDLASTASDSVGAGMVNWKQSLTGAAVRTALAKAREVEVNANDFTGCDPTGATSSSAAIQAAIDAVNTVLGGGEVVLSPGTYLIDAAIIAKSFVTIRGKGTVGYAMSPGETAVVLKRGTANNQILNTGSASNWGVVGIEFDGNNGVSGDSLARDTYGIAKGSGDGGFVVDLCTFVNLTYGIGNSSAIGSPMITRSQFRTCGVGVKNAKDAVIRGNNFTGCKFAAIELNTGAVRVEGNLIEFQRTGTGLDELAYGLYITSNANEIMVANNRFDRNAGNDIRILSGAKRPRNITITGNHFMRGAWGTDVSAAYRCAIRVSSADNVTISGGNQFYAANSNPSTARGFICPRIAIVHEDCNGILIKGNGYHNIANAIPLGDGDSRFGGTFLWVASGSGTNEYYLTDTTDPAGNPWTGQPSSVVRNGTTVMASGSAGSLAVDQWAWADNDSLGFSTIYARVTSGTPGDRSLVAYHDTGPVASQLNSSSYGSRSTDVETDDARDAYRAFISTLSTSTFDLKTRKRGMTNHVMPFVLRISADQVTTGATSFADMPFLITRTNTTTLPGVANGNIVTRENGLTFGWSGAVDIAVSVQPNMLGDTISVTVENKSNYQVEFTAELLW